MKVFCIGFNKMGTSSLNQYFIDHGMKSLHSTDWWYWKDISNFKKYDCFTDGYERYNNVATFPDLDLLEKNFKDCKFILQTRSLFDWMVSRVNQGSYNYLIGLKSKEIDDEVMFRWIEDRNYWYNKVHEYFEDKSNLIIINIKDNNEEKINRFLGLKDNSIKIKKMHQSTKSKKSLTKDLNKEECKKIVEKFLSKYLEKEEWYSNGIVKIKKLNIE